LLLNMSRLKAGCAYIGYKIDALVKRFFVSEIFMHFTTGFSKAKVVLAIDKDPKAPIFDACDIGIVCDAGEIVPLLIEEFKQG